MDLKRGAQLAVDKVVKVLEEISRPISTKEEIAQVGTISANGEREIGDLLSEAMERVGKEGVITIQDGKTMANELDVIEGMRFDRGYISPYFITDNKTQVCEFEKPLILLMEKKISTLQSIVPLLESVVRSQRPLLIISEDVESEALATLVVNKVCTKYFFVKLFPKSCKVAIINTFAYSIPVITPATWWYQSVCSEGSWLRRQQKSYFARYCRGDWSTSYFRGARSCFGKGHRGTFGFRRPCQDFQG